MGVKISNHTPHTIIVLFQPFFILNIPCVTVLAKVTYWQCEISNLKFLKQE